MIRTFKLIGEGRKYFLFYVLFFLVLVVKAEFSDLQFSYLTINNGLSDNRVSSVLRDSKDYIWIGTNDGLNRYDGTNVKVFREIEPYENSISNNNILCIYEDQFKNLWIGTSRGLNKYNREKESFQKYYTATTNNDGVNWNNINDIVEDKMGTLWIASENGLQFLKPGETSLSNFPIKNINQNIKPNSLDNISYDNDSNLWLASQDNMFYRVNVFTKQVSEYKIPFLTKGNIVPKRILKHKHQIWIGTDGNGLFRYNTETKAWTSFELNKIGSGISGKNIKNISSSDDRYIYFSIDHGGINRYDLDKGIFEYYNNYEFSDKGLSNDGVWTTYIDKEGILYVGTSAGGLNINNQNKKSFQKYKHSKYNTNSVINDIIYCFFEDSKGLIWIGTDGGGLSIFDPNLRTFKNFRHNPSDINSLSGNAVLCITEDKEQNIWVGTWGAGLNKFDRKSQCFKHYLPVENDPNSLREKSFRKIEFDENGMMWIIYGSQTGIDLFDPNKGVIKHFRNDPADKNSLINNHVLKLYPFRDKMGIASSTGFILYDFKKKAFELVAKYDYTYINDLFIDSKNKIWLSSIDNGILVVENFDKTKKIEKSNIFISDRFTGVIEDDNGKIWFTSKDGLVNYNPDSDEFTRTFIEDGNENVNFAIRTKLKSKDGTIYLGGFDGFYTFKPSETHIDTIQPRLVIDEFRMFNKPVDNTTPGSPLVNCIEETQNFKLKYNQAFFSFGFTAIEHTYPFKLEYRYKLEGYDHDWIETDAQNRYASYTKPPPGKYQFKVISTNKYGVWSKIPTTINIEIIPPVWQKKWFQFIFLITVIGMILFFNYRRIISLKKQKTLLEEKVKIRTSELRITNDELEKNREELLLQNDAFQIQNTELFHANQTKDKLFTIIAHDLRNPFNSIMGLAELLMTDYDKISEKDKHEFVSIIFQSSQTAYELINNLLNWARSQTDHLEIKLSNNNVLDLVQKNKNLLNSLGMKKNIVLDISGIEPQHEIYCDVNMIDTVIRNLITNAIKFSDLNSKIILDSKIGNEYVLISVKDTGVGMSENELQDLFKIEINHSKLGTSGEKGTGLGLILCKEFIEKNNGSIHVASIVGEGTTITLKLPIGIY